MAGPILIILVCLIWIICFTKGRKTMLAVWPRLVDLAAVVGLIIGIVLLGIEVYNL